MKWLIAFLIFTGCASNEKLEHFRDNNELSKRESMLVDKYFTYYSGAKKGSFGFKSTKLKKIACNCYLKISDKCKGKPVGLSRKEKKLWASSMAAEMTLEIYAQYPTNVNDKLFDKRTCN